tara:strand:- start:281 stop:595 length:315 start_codon:yes stop_codon:yes gene_type:complete
MEAILAFGLLLSIATGHQKTAELEMQNVALTRLAGDNNALVAANNKAIHRVDGVVQQVDDVVYKLVISHAAVAARDKAVDEKHSRELEALKFRMQLLEIRSATE